MALSASTTWEVRTTGASTAGGGFNVGNTSMAADLTATVANSAAPVVTSASYSFASGDVGALLFVKSGTNWVPGWYAIASVSGGAATLTASVGSAALYGGAALLNTVAGCATTASPTSGTWSVDYSQQASAQFAFTDLVIGSTTTQLTSAGYPFGKNCVGNLVKITSGTGFTTGWYEVSSVSTVTATMDRAVGTASSTGGVGSLGGALDGFATLNSAMIAKNKAFIRSGTYTQTAGVTFAQASGDNSSSATPTHLIGYYQTRGDIRFGANAANRPLVQLATNTGLIALNFTGTTFKVWNLIVDAGSLGTSQCFRFQQGAEIYNCLARNFATVGFNGQGNETSVLYCEATGGLSTATCAIYTYYHSCYRFNYIHNNACTGIWVDAGSTNIAVISDNLIANNLGASSDGIQLGQVGAYVARNTVYASGRHGINVIASLDYFYIFDNLLSSNGGYGLQLAAASGLPAMPGVDGNAYYGNTSGTRSNADDRGTVNPVNGVAPYFSGFDVICSANPFQNAAGSDFRLNNLAGGGASCRARGVPASWPGNTPTVSNSDKGAVQHADPTFYRGRRGT
jgi:hypothetical protein